MGTSQIRKELHDYIEKADDRLLKMIHALMKADLDEFELDEKQKKRLDDRLASHKENPFDGSSWDEVKARIKKQL